MHIYFRLATNGGRCGGDGGAAVAALLPQSGRVEWRGATRRTTFRRSLTSGVGECVL